MLISDGYGVYRWLPAEQHQLCWAHVVRGLREIAECREAGRLGRRLLRLAQTVFRVRYSFDRAELAEPRYLRRLQAALSLGAQLPWSRYAGRCQHLLAHETRLWTFLRAPDIPLTNNAAERALRGAVLWRKGSFGGLVAPRRAVSQLHPERGRDLPHARLERHGRRAPHRCRRARSRALSGCVRHRIGAVKSVRVNDYPTPDHAWTSDITYIRTRRGWLYLAAVMGLYSRQIVGWVMAPAIERQALMAA